MGLRGRLVTAVDLIRGLGVLSGIDPVEIPGARYTNRLRGKRDACWVAGRPDFFVIHIEAPTRPATRGGRPQVRRRELGTGVSIGRCRSLDDLGPWRLMLMPDHAPLRPADAHVGPVPYLIYDPADPGRAGSTRVGVATAPVIATT